MVGLKQNLDGFVIDCNLDYNVALLDPGVFITNKKADNVHLKNCYQSYSYRE